MKTPKGNSSPAIIAEVSVLESNSAESLESKITNPSSYAAYQDLFLRSLDAILLVDISNGKILEANDSASKLLHKTTEELTSKIIFEFCRTDKLETFQKMIRIASRRYHPKTFEVFLAVANGQPHELICELAASPLKLNNNREVLQLIFRDISEKKANELKISNYIDQIEKANRKLEELATTDGMTGLINFRQFSKLLENEHVRASRYNSNYAIVFCDIDHFKKYNDQNGHPAGDALLKEFAVILKQCARNTDVVARYGGEEFIILCPETSTDQAIVLAERIQTAIRQTKFIYGEKQPLGFISCSIGLSGFPHDGKNANDIVQTADQRLYHSKAQGRNTITVSLPVTSSNKKAA